MKSEEAACDSEDEEEPFRKQRPWLDSGSRRFCADLGRLKDLAFTSDSNSFLFSRMAQNVLRCGKRARLFSGFHPSFLTRFAPSGSVMAKDIIPLSALSMRRVCL